MIKTSTTLASYVTQRYLILKKPVDRWQARESIAIAEREIIDQIATLELELKRLKSCRERLTGMKPQIMNTINLKALGICIWIRSIRLIKQVLVEMN